jgi:hypothetical protein
MSARRGEDNDGSNNAPGAPLQLLSRLREHALLEVVYAFVGPRECASWAAACRVSSTLPELPIVLSLSGAWQGALEPAAVLAAVPRWLAARGPLRPRTLRLRKSPAPLCAAMSSAVLRHDALGCLRRLELGDCWIGDDGAEQLAAALLARLDAGFTPAGLEALVLRRNNITAAGTRALAAALARPDVCPKLALLDLDMNSVGAAGAEALAVALATNTALEMLYLGSNGVRADGALALGRALAAPACTLRCLDLNNNRLGIEGVGVLAQALRTNVALTSLCLAFNGLAHEQGGAARLLDMLEAPLALHPALESLDLRSNGLEGNDLLASLPGLKLR